MMFEPAGERNAAIAKRNWSSDSYLFKIIQGNWWKMKIVRLQSFVKATTFEQLEQILKFARI